MEDLIVLVVDDESLIVLMIEDMLHEGGFKTKVASSGEKAIKLIDENEGKFSALITDVNLGPGICEAGMLLIEQGKLRLRSRSCM